MAALEDRQVNGDPDRRPTVRGFAAVVAVSSFAPAVRWYEVVLGRSADRHVGDGCVAWELRPGASIHVMRRTEDDVASGPVELIVEVDHVDAHIARLLAHQIPVDVVVAESKQFRTATVADADGNVVVFVEDLSADPAATEGDAPGW